MDESEQIFQRLVNEYRLQVRPELIEFLAPYSPKPDEILNHCYQHSDKNVGRMLHSLYRLVGLADEASDITIKILWCMVCADALSNLEGNPTLGSRARTIKFFEDHLDQQDLEFLKENFTLSLADPSWTPRSSTELELDEIIGAFYCVRSEVVHEGISFFTISDDESDYPTLERVNTVTRPTDPPVFRVYDISMSYTDLRRILIVSALNCIVAK